ncbi:osmotically-inducible protein OsmY [Salirhabdus euzebyi]|uniref:Osmotically-inducible protein OsmY n=1 Tax=Salirhabdus euzebyi TaxID=394506 RepID=A0A841PY94_9BACI|nr:hypothetical protein [Salirhabdus euzebyi]MBB6451861.1 osmotically-inducible protein OsmY [Salirhabdus euzebyi]
MDVEDKKVSKMYRKILTSNEVIGLMAYQNMDGAMQEKVRQKMLQNGSVSARTILNKINQWNQAQGD